MLMFLAWSAKCPASNTRPPYYHSLLLLQAKAVIVHLIQGNQASRHLTNHFHGRRNELVDSQSATSYITEYRALGSLNSGIGTGFQFGTRGWAIMPLPRLYFIK